MKERYEPWHFQPLHLNTNQRENPSEVIEEFFSCFWLPDVRENIQLLLEETLQANSEISRMKPVETVYFCRKLLELIEAVHHMQKIDKKMVPKLLKQKCSE
jgi:hypothetical protein